MTTEPEESQQLLKQGNRLKFMLGGSEMLISDGYVIEELRVDSSPEKATLNENDQVAYELAGHLGDICNRLEKILRSKNKTVTAMVGGRRVNITHVGRATLEEIHAQMERGYRMLERYVYIKYNQDRMISENEASIGELKLKNEGLENHNKQLIALMVGLEQEHEAMRQELELLKRGLGGDELRRGKRVL